MKTAATTFIASACFGMEIFGASFQGLGDLAGGMVFSVATGVSADGKVVAGYSSSSNSATSYEAFRWTATNGMVGLGDLAGGTFTSFANAISADGSTIVGQSYSTNGTEAFRWTQAAGMAGLGDLPGGDFFSTANGVSASGAVVAGYGASTLSGTRSEAFRWTTTNGMEALGDLPGGNFDSRAWGISADGSVIVGESTSSNGNEAFRWTAATGMVGLGDLTGGLFNSIAYGISADGSTIVGYGYPTNSSHEAFRWTLATGIEPLGFLPCDTWSIGRATSGNGSVVVGDPQTTTCKCVFIWDVQHGIRELLNVLTDGYGLNLTGWQLCRATALSYDGNIIVGYGINPSGQTEAWMADLTPPSLAARRSGNNVVLAWPSNAQGFTLQWATNLISPIDWSDATGALAVAGAEFVSRTPQSKTAGSIG